ncbi:hypothetical protein EI693_04260 [Pseudomonas oryziphila]|uniref:Uncharacterized protein n=1 Tax=Pseudomonas oryziphila TaxID=2894079 RepID=A0ABN5TEC5_9PSED|nr:hypothetical protein EI693_04260 [Pseudomonas oryziphila]
MAGGVCRSHSGLNAIAGQFRSARAGATYLVGATVVVGAALCRERAAKRPQFSATQHKSPGLLRSPFATQGRSYSCRAVGVGAANCRCGLSREKAVRCARATTPTKPALPVTGTPRAAR